ncbi:MAG: hypothetical protein ACJ763_14325 [Bdellovibrionia bacterium]
MKKLVLLALALLILPRPGFSAPARMFQFQNKDKLNFSLEASEWERLSSKVYSFVSSYIPDPRPQEPIEIVFDPELDCAGFSSRSAENHRQVRINTKIRSQLDYQVILAHELTHVLRHMHQPNETYWLDEGLAKWMEWKYIGEFPKQMVTTLNSSSVVRLLDEPLNCGESGGSDYASSYFFVLYLRNHLGGDAFIQLIGTSKDQGWDNIERSAQALKSIGVISVDQQLLNRQSLLEHFAFALAFNNPFIADYALFLLDLKYSPTQQQVLHFQAAVPESASSCSNFEFEISTSQQPFIRKIESLPRSPIQGYRYIQVCL